MKNHKQKPRFQFNRHICEAWKDISLNINARMNVDVNFDRLGAESLPIPIENKKNKKNIDKIPVWRNNTKR